MKVLTPLEPTLPTSIAAKERFEKQKAEGNLETGEEVAWFANGCFWGTEVSDERMKNQRLGLINHCSIYFKSIITKA
jgi:hypothetical protein